MGSSPNAVPDARHRSRWTAAAGLALLAGCSGNGLAPRLRVDTFAPVAAGDALTQAEVEVIVAAAAAAVDVPDLAIAVVDRIGNVLRVYNRDPAAALADADNNVATGLARATAYLSHSQAPLTSRTGQFISTFHFPSRFGAFDFNASTDPNAYPVQNTIGVQNTPQGPLWQIDASNRGAPIASANTNPPTAFDAGQAIPQLTNPDGSVPSLGLVALPGAVPLYKTVAAPGGASVARRLVGGIGVYAADPATNLPRTDVMEFAAIAGSQAGPRFDFMGVPPEGAVYLVGVLLPFVGQTTRPAGVGAGAYDPARNLLTGAAGQPDPFGWLISPRDSASGTPFTAAEVRTIIDACVAESLRTHAAIRLPADTVCRMIITVTDVAGVILGAFRMDDATLFSLEISITKARNSFYYSNPGSRDFSGSRANLHPLAGIVPPGTAITCRTLGFLSQPFFPPTIDGSPPGPLFALAQENRRPARFNQMGFAPTPADDPAVQPDTQSGIIFFPGSAPLYRDGTLIGGIGVSGDGVEQDDLVTARGIQRAQAQLGFRLEPPPDIRCDRFTFNGVRLPYFKFPQHPGG